MKKDNNEPPLTHLSEEQLDNLLEEMGLSFNEENQQSILSKIEKKKKIKYFPQMKKRKKILLSLVAGFILFPTSVFAANKVWELVTHQEGFLTTLTLMNESKKESAFYQLGFTYIPEGLVELPHTNGQKYWQEATKTGGFSTVVIKPTEMTKFEVPYSGEVVEQVINQHQTYFVSRLNSRNPFKTVAFVLFEEEGLIVEIFFDEALSNKEQQKIIQGMNLTPVTKEKATPVSLMDDEEEVESDVERQKIIKKDNKNVTEMGKSFYDSIENIEGSKQLPLKITPIKNQIFTQLPNDASHQGSYIGQLATLIEAGKVTKEGLLEIIPSEHYRLGDGEKNLDTKLEDLAIQPIYQEVTVEIINESQEETPELYFHPTLYRNQETNKGDLVEGIIKETYLLPYDFNTEPVYLSVHGEGDSYYNIGKLDAGESQVITLGYLVIVPEASDFMLQFNLSARYSEDSNEEHYHWVKLRSE